MITEEPGDLFVSERFQTFNTRLRPHRIAVLTNVADQDWQNTCIAIIEYLSQIWGGYHSLIVPTDGKSIDDIFWALLSSFDPDVILRYQKTGADAARIHPGEFEESAAASVEQAAVESGSFEGLESTVRKRRIEFPYDDFSVSPELAKQLLIRLAPFHFGNELQVGRIVAGAAPAYPYTSVTNIVEFLPVPDTIFEIRNNLTLDRQAPPPLWLAAEPGIATPDYQAALQTRGVTCAPKFMSTESDGDIIKWGIQPWHGLSVNSPFSFTRLALATVRAVALRQDLLPSIVVQGDTICDFCLYYGLSRLHGRAVWLPSWFDPVPNFPPNRLMTAVINLYHLGERVGCRQITLVSASRPAEALQETVATLRAPMRGASLAVGEGNLGTFIRKVVEYPSKVYLKKNVEHITTHQIVDNRLPGFFESPVPLELTQVDPQIHRWLVEISFTNAETPRHPALGNYVISGQNMGDVRAGNDGVAFQCPGIMVLGHDIELQTLRVSVSVPTAEKIFHIALASCGYHCEISDKGIYQSETIKKFGGINAAGGAVRHGQTSRLLREFVNKRGPATGVYDEGVFLSDKRRYLNFACMLKFIPDEAFAREIVDDYISKQVFYRGLVLKCNRCSDVAWFSIADVTHCFTCRRCGTTQQYTYSSWRYPNEPSWFYKLDEMIYQMLSHNGDVTLLTLDTLNRALKDHLQFAPELSIKPQGALRATMEIDIPCIMDGKMIIGEAKSVQALATNKAAAFQSAVKYRDLAKQLGAYGVIFSTSMPRWNEIADKAIDEAFARDPFLKIYRYTGAELGIT